MNTDMQNKNNSERIINLSNITNEEAINQAKLSKKLKVRIQGKFENVIRTKTNNIVKNTVLSIATIVNKKSREIMDELDTKSKFSTSYNEEQIAQMAMMIPWKYSKALTIRFVQEYFTMLDLSWRVSQKIIDKEREIFPNRNR